MPKLLFITQYAFYPDASGGSDHSGLYLFKSLRQLGWQVEIICSRHLPGIRKLFSLYFWHSCWQSLLEFRMLFPVSLDEELGHPCWRVITTKFQSEQQWLKFLDKRLKAYQPDVVLGHSSITCPLLKSAASQGYHTVYLTRNTCAFEYDNNLVIPEQLQLLANSPFTASIITQFSGYKPEVILPFIETENYRVISRQRKYITFINFVPEKGAMVAIEIARQLPQEKFLFVKGKWPGYTELQNSLLESVSALSNVEIWEHQQDMRRVYEVTDILLFPSQFNETFGRVIIEAQVNNIPVVAAEIAGVPYTLGKGGILIKPIDKIQAYIDAIKSLRTNEKLYAELSELAFKNSQRQEFNPQYQVKKFVDLVGSYQSSIKANDAPKIN